MVGLDVCVRADDICPLSQSLVAYRVLKESSVPTGLIVYPKEKHGFDQPVHRCAVLLD